MTNTVKFLPALTDLAAVEDKLAEMTDGSFEVVAHELYDHPNAKVDVDGRVGGEPGQKLGYIVLGPREAVNEWIDANYDGDHSEMTSRGLAVEGPLPGESRTELVRPAPNALAVNVYRYPDPDLADDELAAFRVDSVAFADDGNFLGVLRANADETWSAVDRHWQFLARNVTREAALAAIVGVKAPEPKRAPVTGLEHQIVELTVRLRVDVGAWELAYGDQGGAANLAEDVRVYVENLLSECSQRSVPYGGEGGFADFEVDHR